MQVSTDGIVRFIGRSSFKGGQNSEIFHQVTFADESGDTLKMFCDEDVYIALENMQFGDPMSLILNVTQYNKGISTRLKQVITNG